MRSTRRRRPRDRMHHVDPYPCRSSLKRGRLSLKRGRSSLKRGRSSLKLQHARVLCAQHSRALTLLVALMSPSLPFSLSFSFSLLWSPEPKLYILGRIYRVGLFRLALSNPMEPRLPSIGTDRSFPFLLPLWPPHHRSWPRNLPQRLLLVRSEPLPCIPGLTYRAGLCRPSS